MVTEPATAPAKKPPALIAWVMGVVDWVMRLKPVRVFIDFGEHRGPLLAAGLSNKAVFAVFAAIWVAFSAFGLFLADNPELQKALLEIISTAVPGLIDTGEGGAIDPDDLINTDVLGWTGAIALIGLFLTALGWLAAARDAVRLMAELPGSRTNFYLLKLKDLGLALAFGALLLVSAALSVFATQALGGALAWLGIEDDAVATTTARVMSVLLMFILDTVVLGALYRILAGVRIPMRFLSQGALLGAAALGVLKLLGTALLGATSNPLLAGFVVIIGLLIWFNLVCQVILLAADWVFVSMRDAGVPLDTTLATEQAEAEAAKRERLREELRAELAAEKKPGFFGRLFGRRAK